MRRYGGEIENTLRCFPHVGQHTFERTPGFYLIYSIRWSNEDIWKVGGLRSAY